MEHKFVSAESAPADRAARRAEIVGALERNHGADAVAQVERALALVSTAHGAEPDRGLSAALLLAEMRLDADAVAAAVIVPHRDSITAEMLSERLGSPTANLVERAGRVSQIRWDRPDHESAEVLRKMFMAMAKDARVVLIVLALRVELIRDLRAGQATAAEEESSGEHARRIAQETLDVFAPLANRLGIWHIKWELEDGAFSLLEPQIFDDLQRLLEEKREQRQAYIDEAISLLSAKLELDNITASIKGRPKHVYSIYKKMRRKQISFDQVYDVSAVRAVVERVQDCYAILGLVHSLWVPIPSEFDDYIAMPKPNGYQSLHTAVIGPRGRPLEVQIRTQAMHRFAEFGVAAHWAYKEQRQAVEQDKFMLLRQLLDWEKELTDPKQFVESLKTDVFQDQVFVFTPDGDIVDLPKGSTPLDFAYRIHTMVGHRCRGARVNDQIVPIDKVLNTGDRVEILTHKLPHPSRDWMNPNLGFLKTLSARQKVKHWFRELGRETAIAAGRELVTKELERANLSRVSIEEIAAVLKSSSAQELYAHVGFGDRRPQAVVTAALQLERAHSNTLEAAVLLAKAKKRRRDPSGLSLDGVGDIQGVRAKCCSPLPGDDVLGFVTRGRGIVIHRRDCAQIQESREPERLVDIDWGPEGGELHTVSIEVHASDRPGFLGELLKLVAQMGIYITNANLHADRKGASVIQLALEFQSTRQVAQALDRIDRHPEVTSVRRMEG